MNQLTSTQHQLQMQDDSNSWHPPQAGMYRPAQSLAYQGRIWEAIDAAYQIRMEHYGDCRGVKFRVVTKTTTISFQGDVSEYQ